MGSICFSNTLKLGLLSKSGAYGVGSICFSNTLKLVSPWGHMSSVWVVFVLATLSNDNLDCLPCLIVWVVFVLATLSNLNLYVILVVFVWVVFVLATLSN